MNIAICITIVYKWLMLLNTYKFKNDFLKAFNFSEYEIAKDSITKEEIVNAYQNFFEGIRNHTLTNEAKLVFDIITNMPDKYYKQPLQMFFCMMKYWDVFGHCEKCDKFFEVNHQKCEMIEVYEEDFGEDLLVNLIENLNPITIDEDEIISLITSEQK